MLEFYEPGAAIIEDSVAKAVARLTRTNRSTLDFMFGAQKTLLDEIVFAGNEMFDRARFGFPPGRSEAFPDNLIEKVPGKRIHQNLVGDAPQEGLVGKLGRIEVG